jgi:hypothetical protein
MIERQEAMQLEKPQMPGVLSTGLSASSDPPVAGKVLQNRGSHPVTSKRRIEMQDCLKIRFRDLGVDHDGYVEGTSLNDFVECVERRLTAAMGLSDEEIAESRDLIRSALIQSCHPKNKRSASLSMLIS